MSHKQVEFDLWQYQAAGTTPPPMPLEIRWKVWRHIAAALVANGWPKLRKWE